MRNIWTIAKREYKLYFNGPIAYTVGFLYLLIVGYFIYAELSNALGMAMYQPYTPNIQLVTGSIMVFLLIFTIPAVTMRLMAEEARTGTMELLLTAPLRDWELILGKWLSGSMFMLSLLAITLVYPIILNQISSPGIDQGPMISGYLGLTLMIASLVALGVGISSLFNNQIAAFFVTLAVILFLWFFRMPQSIVGPLAEVGNYFNFVDHYVTFWRGVIDIKDIMYYLSVTAVGLFVGTMAVEMRRWR